MSGKRAVLIVTLLAALAGSACREAGATATPSLSPSATRQRPAPTGTPVPTPTAVGLPPAAGDRGATHADLPQPALDSGWTTFPITRPVTALAQAADGAIWVGHEQGAFRFTAYAAGEPWTTAGDGLAETAVNAFFPLPGGMWAGHDDGASYFDAASGEWSHLRPAVAPSAGLYRGDVHAMTADGDGRLWFGTSGGVTVWDGDRFFYDDFLTVEERFARRRPHFVYALLFDGEDLWAGTERGLFSYDEAYQLTRYDPEALQEAPAASARSPAVRALALDGDGRLLLAVNHRLLRREADGAFNTLFVAETDIHTITVAAGDVWLGLDDDHVLRGRDGRWQEVAPGPNGAPLTGRHILVDYLSTRWFAAEGSARLSRFVPTRPPADEADEANGK